MTQLETCGPKGIPFLLCCCQFITTLAFQVPAYVTKPCDHKMDMEGSQVKRSDTRYHSIIDTLERVLNAKLYHNIYIYGRASRQRLKGTSVGLRKLSKNGDNPLQDYLNERGKHWSENDLRFFTSDILQLVKQMIWRGASNEELKEIFDVFDLENVEDLLAPETTP